MRKKKELPTMKLSNHAALAILGEHKKSDKYKKQSDIALK